MILIKSKIDAIRDFQSCDCDTLSDFRLTLFSPEYNISCVIDVPSTDIDFSKLKSLLYKYRKYLYHITFNNFLYSSHVSWSIFRSHSVSLHKFFDIVSNHNINF